MKKIVSANSDPCSKEKESGSFDLFTIVGLNKTTRKVIEFLAFESKFNQIRERLKTQGVCYKDNFWDDMVGYFYQAFQNYQTIKLSVINKSGDNINKLLEQVLNDVQDVDIERFPQLASEEQNEPDPEDFPNIKIVKGVPEYNDSNKIVIRYLNVLILIYPRRESDFIELVLATLYNKPKKEKKVRFELPE